MADNSFSSISSKTSASSETAAQNKNTRNNTTRINVLKTPSDFQRNIETKQNTHRIEGRVTQIDPKTNRVVIRTSLGEFEVQYPKGQQLPEKTTQVELKIVLSKRGVQTAVIRELPLQPPKNDQLQLQTSSQKQLSPYKAPDIASPQKELTLKAITKPLIGEPVKLIPLKPSELASIEIKLPPPQSLNTLKPPTSISDDVITLEILKNIPAPKTNLVTLTPESLKVQNIQLNSFTSITPIPVAPAISQTLFTKSTPQTSLHQSPLQAEALQTVISNIPKTSILPASVQIQTLSSTPEQVLNLITAPGNTIQPVTLQTQAGPIIVTPAKAETTSIILKAPSSDISLIDILQSSKILPKITTNISPTTLPAIVIGHSTNNSHSIIAVQSIIHDQTPQFFTLQNNVLPIGTILHIDTTMPQTAQTVPITSTNIPTPLPVNLNQILSPQSWPVLNEFIEILQQAAPQLVQNISQIIPTARAPAQIPPAILLFVLALKGGDLNSWMGDKSQDIIKRLGKSDLFNRLSNDFSNISKAAGEALPNDWRGLIFPFQGETELRNIALFYKREAPENPKDHDRKQTRFIFDMDLTRMGIVQIDALFKPLENNKRLDIVLRTEAPLSAPMKQMMRQNYSKILNYSQISGEIRFQDSKEKFVQILMQKENVKFTT